MGLTAVDAEYLISKLTGAGFRCAFYLFSVVAVLPLVLVSLLFAVASRGVVWE